MQVTIYTTAALLYFVQLALFLALNIRGSYSLVGHAAPESLRPIANEVRKQARQI